MKNNNHLPRKKKSEQIAIHTSILKDLTQISQLLVEVSRKLTKLQDN